MNPWFMTFGLFAFGTVMLLIGFYNGHAMGYADGERDRKMKAGKSGERKVVMSINHIDVAEFPLNTDRPLEFSLRVKEAKAEEPSDEDAAETTDNEIRHDRPR